MDDHDVTVIDHCYNSGGGATSSVTGGESSERERTPSSGGGDGVHPFASQAWRKASYKFVEARSRAFTPAQRVDLCNSWLNATVLYKDTQVTTRFSVDEGLTHHYRYERTIIFRATKDNPNGTRTGHVMKFSTVAASLKEAKQIVCGKVVAELMRVANSNSHRGAAARSHMAQVQMDSGEPVSQESIQGQADQSSTKEVNTIITRDAAEEETIDMSLPSTSDVSSTEPMSTFPKLTSRWMVLDSFKVQTSDTTGTNIFKFILPRDLMKKAKCAPNVAPFEAYTYGEFVFEFKIILNGNKFQAGKLLVACRNDTYKANNTATTIQGLMSRPHGILDFAARNEVKIVVPWKYHASFVRIVNTTTTTTAVNAGECATLEAVVLSPLNVASDGVTNAYGQVFYRVKKANFTGMSFRVSFQMDDMIDKVLPKRTLKALAKGVEAAVDQMGSSKNQDKPNDPRSVVFVPKPRAMFPNVRGIDDATALRASPATMTSYHRVHGIPTEPKSPKQLARIWGLRQAFTWATSDEEGKRLVDLKIDPTQRNEVTSVTAPTPLEYAAGMFMFWSGTVEIRVDFVSTSFHQGTVMLSAEFNRPVTSPDVCSTSSTYTKTFHLGEQKSVTMTVPFILDTTLRRTGGATSRFLPTFEDQPSKLSDLDSCTNLAPDIHALFRVTVVNQLKPVQTVSSNIQALVFWRAGKDFSFQGLKQCDFTSTSSTNVDNNVFSLPASVMPKAAKGAKVYALPFEAPKSNASHVASVQMDTGEKEDVDTTADFKAGPSAKGVQNVDDEIDFKDILRRPTMIINRAQILASGTYNNSTKRTNVGWMIPVMTPSQTTTQASSGTVSPDNSMGSLAVSPSAAIMNLFRGWRGSTKYTFVFEVQDAPGDRCTHIYITYIPHSGTVMKGAWSFANSSDDPNRAIAMPYMNGYATEIVVPSINPTSSVVVPYETELNWTLTFEDDASINYTWRDKAYLNAGHVCVCPIGGTARMTVFWSAGDDFELSMFYGPGVSYNNSVGWRLTDVGTITGSTQTVGDVGKTKMSEEVKTLVQNHPELKWMAKPKVTPAAPAVAAPAARPSPAPPEVGMSDEPFDEVTLTSKSFTHYGLTYKNSNIQVRIPLHQATEFDFMTSLDKLNSGLSQRQKDSAIHWYRSTPQTQMMPSLAGFRLEGAATRVASAFSKVTPRVVRNAAIATIPVIGAPVALAMTAAEVSDSADKTLGSIKDCVDRTTTTISDLAETVGVSVDSLTRVISQAVESVGHIIGGVVSITSAVYNLLLDLFIAWYHKSWIVVGVSIVRIFGTTVLHGLMGSALSLGRRLGEAIEAVVHEQNNVQVQGDGMSTVEVLISVLVGIAGTLLGVALDPSQFSFLGKLFRRMTKASGFAYFVQIITFVRSTFKALVEIVMTALGRVAPEAAALRALSDKGPEIQAFIRDAQDVVCEANFPMWSVPAFKVKIWRTVLQAMHIQRCMTLVPNNVVSPVLSRLCADVIKKGQEKFRELSACPVRYEPFVICVEGETNIGKSYMVEEMITRLLTAIGYSAPASGVSYIRQPGNKFWSGYVDQPAVIYDDWMQMNDNTTMTEQVSELFQLKSPATFIPNMAHLEEKKVKANPLIIVLACNHAFPNVPVASSIEAVYRRRDIVLHAQRSELHANVPVRQLPLDVQQNFGHLEFGFYEDSSDPESYENNEMGFGPMMEEMANIFRQYHEQELVNVGRRLDQLFRINNTIPPEMVDLRDPFGIYYTAPVEPLVQRDPNLWVPADILERDVQLAYQQLLAMRPQQQGEGEQPAEAEAQLDLGAVVMPIGHAVLCSAVAWKHVVAVLRAGVQQLTTWLTGFDTERPRHTCDICGEEAATSYACSNARTPEGQLRHSTCDSCKSQLAQPRCPVCRNEQWVPLIQEQNVTWAIRAIVYMAKTGATFDSVLGVVGTMLTTLANCERIREVMEYVIFGLIWCVASRVSPQFYIYVGTRVVVTAADWYMRSAEIQDYVNRSQMDPGDVPAPEEPVAGPSGEQVVDVHPEDPQPLGVERLQLGPIPDPSPPQVEAHGDDEVFSDASSGSSPRRNRLRDRHRRIHAIQESIRDIVHARANDEEEMITLVVHDMGERVDRQLPEVHSPLGAHCAHQAAQRSVRNGGVWYRDSTWWVQSAGVNVPFGDHPCNIHCPWYGVEGAAAQMWFYERYLDLKRAEMTRCAIRWISATPEMKDYYKATVPAIYQPDWMFAPVIMDREANALVVPNWWDYLQGVWEKYKLLIKLCLSVAGACAAIYTGHQLYAAFSPSGAPPPDVEDRPAPGSLAAAVVIEQQSEPRRIVHAARPEPIRRAARTQASETLDDVVEDRILTNAISADVYMNGQKIRVLHGYGLCDHCVIIPRHCLAVLLDPDLEIRIGPVCQPHIRTVVKPVSGDFKPFANNDFCLWKWPPSTNAFKDIRKFFLKESDLDRHLPANAEIFILPGRSISAIVKAEIRLEGAKSSLPVLDANGEVIEVHDVLVYNFSRAGACGSLVKIKNSQRPLIAMHVAGCGDEFDGKGYGIIVTQEMLQDLTRGEVVILPPEVQMGPIEDCAYVFPEEVQVVHHGSLPQNKTPHVPHKSKLERSSVFGLEDLATDIRPAFMDAKDPGYVHVDTPLVAGCKKHGKLTKDFRTDEVARAKTFLKDLLGPIKPLVANPQRLTPEEAVVGFPGVEYYDPLDLNTSVGYPLMLKPGVKKADFVEVERDEDERPISAVLHPELRDIVEEAHKQRSAGLRYPTLWVDTLKDEKRPEAKVMKYAGTRVICNGPFEHTIAMRQDFLHFSAAFMKNRRQLCHAVGINPTSREWNELASRLIHKNKEVVTLDYSNFGPGFNAVVCEAACDVIIEWTLEHVQGVSESEMRTLMREVQNSYHICKNTVYSQMSGAPSGNQMTSVINSLVNIMYVYIAWYNLEGETALRAGRSPGGAFLDDVCLCVYGDDVIMSVRGHPDFNGQTISAFLAQYGIVATDSEKSGTIKATMPIKEAEFLKRKFRWSSERNIWVSQLREETLKATTQWVWKSPNRDESTRVNCEVAVMNAHGHGPQFFEDFKGKVNRALAKRHITPVLWTWKEVDNLFLDHDYINRLWT